MGQKKDKKIFLIVFIAVILVISGGAVIGDAGLFDVLKLKKERNEIARRTAELQQDNRRLSREIELLKTDNRYITKVARREFGMIGNNEMLYKIETQEW
jgi:cell division protein FtsB